MASLEEYLLDSYETPENIDDIENQRFRIKDDNQADWALRKIARARQNLKKNEAKIIRLIFNMVAQGCGYSEVISALNMQGAKTKRGNPFGKNSIYDILRNEKYSGTYVFNRATSARLGKRNTHTSKPDDEVIRISGGMPAIVPYDEWKRVQEIMDGRRYGPQPRKSADSLYVLTGKVICGECNGAMTGNSGTGGRNKQKYRFYSCSTRKRNKQCSNPDIRKEILEGFVFDEIQKLFVPDKMGELARKLEDYYRKQLSASDNERDYLTGQLHDIAQRMDNLFDAIETGTIDPAVAGPRLNNLSQEQETLEQALYQLEQRNKLSLSRADIMAYLKTNHRIVTERTDEKGCRQLVEAYVDKVIVGRNKVETILKVDVSSDNNGGGGGNRTRVRKGNSKSFYERSVGF
jgi:site-specific DNA recombinase